MTQLQNDTYTVDVVLCIDGTGSMAGIIDKVKEQAKKAAKETTDTGNLSLY